MSLPAKKNIVFDLSGEGTVYQLPDDVVKELAKYKLEELAKVVFKLQRGDQFAIRNPELGFFVIGKKVTLQTIDANARAETFDSSLVKDNERTDLQRLNKVEFSKRG